MNVTIIGLGLIGGSIALDLKKSGFATRIIGIDNNAKHGEEAIRIGLVDEVLPLSAGIEAADIIVIAIPVDKARQLITEVLSQVTSAQTVVDMGSTKSGICKAAHGHANRPRFVAAHPIAGTEHSGPSAAIHDLFRDKNTILCDTDQSAPDAVSQVRSLFEALGMRISTMTSAAHDKHIAYVSHLSHVSSFTLGLTVLGIEKDESTIFDLAGSGFESTVRLAKSSPEMWAPIFQQNKGPLLEALDQYLEQLHQFRDLIAEDDQQGTRERMEQANAIRRILNR